MVKRKKREKRSAAEGARKRAQKVSEGYKGSTVKVPERFPIYTLKKKNVLNFYPYEVKQTNQYVDAGMFHYEKSFWIHRNVGIEERAVVCPKLTFGKPCPICEHLLVLRKDADENEEIIKAIKPSYRQLFVVEDQNDKDKGLQVFDICNWYFGALLDEMMKSSDDDDRFWDFANQENGFTLKISAAIDPYSGKHFKASSIQFKPRRDYTDEMMDDAPCLDDMIVETPYETIKNLYYSLDPTDDEDEDEGPAEKPEKKQTKKKKKPEPETNDDDDEEDKDDASDDFPYEEPKTTKKKSKKAKKEEPEEEEPEEDDDEPEDDEDDEPEEDDVLDDEEDEEEEPEEDDDDDDDEPEEDEEDEDEEEPVKKKSSKKTGAKAPKKSDVKKTEKKESTKKEGKKKSKELVCPSGGTFGEDTDEIKGDKGCAKCKIWTECDDAQYE